MTGQSELFELAETVQVGRYVHIRPGTTGTWHRRAWADRTRWERLGIVTAVETYPTGETLYEVGLPTGTSYPCYLAELEMVEPGSEDAAWLDQHGHLIGSEEVPS